MSAQAITKNMNICQNCHYRTAGAGLFCTQPPPSHECIKDAPLCVECYHTIVYVTEPTLEKMDARVHVLESNTNNLCDSVSFSYIRS
jgi:hypothetical protein